VPQTVEPPALSAAWFRAKLDGYRDAAIDNPTSENVTRYLVLQKIVMDKAAAYQEMASSVVLNEPLLDANTERPLDTMAANAANDVAGAATEALLKKLGETTGLAFFFSSDCEICASQVHVLDSFARQYGTAVIMVSLDGKPLPGIPLERWVPDAGQAKAMGVDAAPALVLMHPADRGMRLLGRSVFSIASLGQRLLALSHEAGWIGAAEFEATKPVHEHPLLEASRAALPALIDDPSQVAAFLRQLSRGP
jgi:conjugal transfer pilus assembly protein TraF